MSGDLFSFTRFSCVVFPMFIGLALHFDGSKTKNVWYVGIVIAACVHLALLYCFINFMWAG